MSNEMNAARPVTSSAQLFEHTPNVSSGVLKKVDLFKLSNAEGHTFEISVKNTKKNESLILRLKRDLEILASTNKVSANSINDVIARSTFNQAEKESIHVNLWPSQTAELEHTTDVSSGIFGQKTVDVLTLKNEDGDTFAIKIDNNKRNRNLLPTLRQSLKELKPEEVSVKSIHAAIREQDPSAEQSIQIKAVRNIPLPETLAATQKFYKMTSRTVEEAENQTKNVVSPPKAEEPMTTRTVDDSVEPSSPEALKSSVPPPSMAVEEAAHDKARQSEFVQRWALAKNAIPKPLPHRLRGIPEGLALKMLAQEHMPTAQPVQDMPAQPSSSVPEEATRSTPESNREASQVQAPKPVIERSGPHTPANNAIHDICVRAKEYNAATPNNKKNFPISQMVLNYKQFENELNNNPLKNDARNMLSQLSPSELRSIKNSATMNGCSNLAALIVSILNKT